MRRYGGEFRQLLDDAPATPATAIDVARHGLSLHARRAPGTGLHLITLGGTIMRDHPQRSAVLGAAVLLPTAVLIGVAVLKYVVGVAAPFDAIEPAMTPLVTHPLGETVLTLAPYLALVLALLPVVRGVPRWEHGRLVGTFSLAAPVVNIVIATLSAAVALFMAVYWVTENL
ncbi:MAG: hypothetical protein OEW24_02010 [Chloroflexota bacterium]|nr:hypothetical protein [Chloroflexota bacterium]